jgi:hypothetical protein
MTDEELRAILRAELVPIAARLDAIEARVSGLPLIGSAIEVLRRDTRPLKAAINDMGRTNITAGEVEALHADIDRLQNEGIEVATRLATMEQRLDDLEKR